MLWSVTMRTSLLPVQAFILNYFQNALDSSFLKRASVSPSRCITALLHVITLWKLVCSFFRSPMVSSICKFLHLLYRNVMITQNKANSGNFPVVPSKINSEVLFITPKAADILILVLQTAGLPIIKYLTPTYKCHS